MDESFLFNVWKQLGVPVQVKVPPSTSARAHALITLENEHFAERVLQQFQDVPIPGASPSTRFILRKAVEKGEKHATLYPRDDPHTLYVGGLGPEVNDRDLLMLFKARFPSTERAWVIYGPHTGQSKLYGFVRILDPNEVILACEEMSGVWLGRHQLVVRRAEFKLKPSARTHSPQPPEPLPPTKAELEDFKPATLQVTNLSSEVEDAAIYAHFESLGAVQVRRDPTLTQAEVQFNSRVEAAQALAKLHHTTLGGRLIEVAFDPPAKSNLSGLNASPNAGAHPVHTLNRSFLERHVRHTRLTTFHPYRARLFTGLVAP